MDFHNSMEHLTKAVRSIFFRNNSSSSNDHEESLNATSSLNSRIHYQSHIVTLNKESRNDCMGKIYQSIK